MRVAMALVFVSLSLSGCTSTLNKERKRPNPSLPEMSMTTNLFNPVALPELR